MPLTHPVQGLPNRTSQDRAFLEAYITMQDNATMVSRPGCGTGLALGVMPWSHVTATAAAAGPPRSELALFWGDPKAYLDSISPRQPLPHEAPGNCEEPVLASRSADTQPCEASSRGESVDRPRGDNPVGPPDEISDLVWSHNGFDDNQIQSGGRSGRHHSLNPEQRRHAALMRAVRNCWHCVFLKYRVCMHGVGRNLP